MPPIPPVSRCCRSATLLLSALWAFPAAVLAQEPAPAAADSLRAPMEMLLTQTVVEAEQEFARVAREVGVRDAFLAFLAPQSVVFLPRASNGRAAYADAPTEPVLHWAPALAESAASDDLGYTTGPFSLLATASGPVISHGWYLSVWKRNESGVWEAVLDIGTQTADMPPAADHVEIPSRPPAPPADAAGRRASLIEMDDLIAAAAQRRGPRRALTPMLDATARLNDGGTIVDGGIRIARTLGDAPVSFHRLGDGVSAAGDLAYTYGEYTLGPLPSMESPSGNWVRIWRVGPDGQWVIVHMLHAPIEH